MMLLKDEPPNTPDLVNDKFRLQLQAMQQIIQELDEALDMEYKRNRAICEAQDAREIEQQQQATLAQFRMFQKKIANQEATGILLDYSSNDTWQDVISPSNCIIQDSGATQHMRPSTHSTSNENCPA